MHSVVDPITFMLNVEKIGIYLIALSLVILFHELAHLLIARRTGVFVEEFAVGMGPRLTGFTSSKTGTKWSLRLLPIGGFCAMRGEDKETDERQPNDQDFRTKSSPQRLAIIAAGPIANLILAYVCILLGIALFARQPQMIKPIVARVFPNSVAARNGLRPGMEIQSVAGHKTPSASAAISAIHYRLGKVTSILVTSGELTKTLVMTPEPCPGNPNLGCVGFVPAGIVEHVGLMNWTFDDAHPTIDRLRILFSLTNDTYGELVDDTFHSFRMLFSHFQQYSSQIVGPIGMGQAAIGVQNLGWDVYLIFIGSISFIIGVANLLPIPGLDGGRILFILVELCRRKPIHPTIEARIHVAGILSLLAIMLIVGAHDIARILDHKSIF